MICDVNGVRIDQYLVEKLNFTRSKIENSHLLKSG